MKKEKIEAIIAKQLQENEELKIKIENKELRINSDIEEEFKDIVNNNENVMVTLEKLHYKVITRFLSTNKFQSLSEANKIAVRRLWQDKQIEEENKAEKEIEEGFQEENKTVEGIKERNPYEESLKKGIPNEILESVLKNCKHLDDDFSDNELKKEELESYLDKFAKEIANFESNEDKEIEKSWLDKWNKLSFTEKRKKIKNWKRYQGEEIINIIEEKIKIQERLNKNV